jgi:hypothetical protein
MVVTSAFPDNNYKVKRGLGTYTTGKVVLKTWELSWRGLDHKNLTKYKQGFI